MNIAPTDDALPLPTGIGAVYSVSQTTTNATDIVAKETGQWITAFYASTPLCNLLSSGKLVQSDDLANPQHIARAPGLSHLDHRAHCCGCPYFEEKYGNASGPCAC